MTRDRETTSWRWIALVAGALLIGVVIALRARPTTLAYTDTVVLGLRAEGSGLTEGSIPRGLDVSGDMDPERPPLELKVSQVSMDQDEYGFLIARVDLADSGRGELADLLDSAGQRAGILFVEGTPVLCFPLGDSTGEELVLSIPYAGLDDEQRHIEDMMRLRGYLVRETRGE